jgi:hypothetical protein
VSVYDDDGYYYDEPDEDAGPTRDELDDAMIEDTVYCDRCHSAWGAGEVYIVDDRSVCVDCTQDAIDALIAGRDRLAAALEALTPKAGVSP